MVAISLFRVHRLWSSKMLGFFWNQLISLILGLRTLFNLKVYFDAKRRLPEFSGLQGRRYPGQPSPHPPPYILTPRRPTPPPGHQHEDSSIGPWRRQTRPIIIFVTPAEGWVEVDNMSYLVFEIFHFNFLAAKGAALESAIWLCL